MKLSVGGKRNHRLVIAFATAAVMTLTNGFGRELRAGEDAAPPPLAPAQNQHVAIPLEAFGKEYLLLTSVIPQARAATSRALASRIVIFELFHDGVDLYESTRGLVVTRDLPARRLLTIFPIVEKNDQRVVIDFGRGMDRILTSGWYTSREGFRPDVLAGVTEIPRSRVFAVELAGGRLMIRQAAQSKRPSPRGQIESRVEMRYFLTPYHATEYELKEHPARDRRYVRFFQTHGHVEEETGRSTTPLMRFHPDKPIKFYYSANTPDDYVQAVKEGILYWNRAFDHPVITVERAPDGVTAPAPDHNIVQWVPWDNAGFAYADAIPDPYTGQTLHGQAYMTSVFAIGNIQRARRILRHFRTLAEESAKDGKEKTEDGEFLFPAGGVFAQSPCTCEVDPVRFAQDMADGIAKLISMSKADDRRILRASQDVVRNVTAHEVGHVLGLRHNFAGSLATTLTHHRRDEWLRAYLTSDEPPDTTGQFVTNSVMEYTDFASRVLGGYQMTATDAIQPHDRAAIRWGYLGETAVREEKMLFATDDDVATWGDVTRFDYGTAPVVTSFAEIAERLRQIPSNIVERYIAAKAPRDPRDRVPLESVVLNVSTYVRPIDRSYGSMLNWFQADVRSLKVERDFDFVGELNRKERERAHWEYLQKQIKQLGGVDRMGFSFLPVDLKLTLKKEPKGVTAPKKVSADKMAETLSQLLDADEYQEFVGLDGETYSFTDEEKKLIRARGKAFFNLFEKELVKAILPVLGKAKRDLGREATGNVADDDVVAELEKRIIELARDVILKRDESKRRKGTLNKGHVEVVEFHYDHETRLAAARMLNDAIGSFLQWSTDAKGKLHKDLKAVVDGALNIDQLKDFKPDQLSRSLRQWYLAQQQILKLLPAKK